MLFSSLTAMLRGQLINGGKNRIRLPFWQAFADTPEDEVLGNCTRITFKGANCNDSSF